MVSLIRAAALAVLLTVAGCSALPYRVETPQLSIVRVEVIKGDLLQQNLKVRMHVQNPNKRDLPVRGVTCEIEVAGEKFAHGESERNFIVPAQGAAEFDVMVTANAAAALLRIAAGGMRGDKLEYRLVGTVQLSSGLLRSLPFEHTGSFDLR